MIDIREYEQLALDSGAYRDIEIDILKETLASWKARPGDPYTILELRDGRVLAGFAVFCRAPNTEFTYDILSLCVDPVYRGKGVGRRLLEMLEEEALGADPAAILRCETSRKKQEAIGAEVLEDCGYALIGHIADFYEGGDDYFMYARHASRPLASASAAGQAAGAAGKAGAAAASAAGNASEPEGAGK